MSETKIIAYDWAIAIKDSYGRLFYELEDLTNPEWVFMKKDVNSFLLKGELVTDVFIGPHDNPRIYAYLTSIGNVYLSGYNLFYQLGTGTQKHEPKPVNILDKFNLQLNERIIQVLFGDYHTAALTNLGRVFAWGYNKSGQVGDGTNSTKNVPTEITCFFKLDDDDKIKQLALTSATSYALTENGKVFEWGEEFVDPLSSIKPKVNQIPKDITSTFKLDKDEKIIKISVGGRHRACLSNKGNLYMWGYNRFGQLGDGTDFNSKDNPIKITNKFNFKSEEKIIDVFLGEDHSAALTSKSNLFTWGWNGAGQLGNGNQINQCLPVNITHNFNLDNGESISQVALGGWYSVALTSKNNVFLWGYKGYFMCGTEKVTSIPTRDIIITTNGNWDDFSILR